MDGGNSHADELVMLGDAARFLRMSERSVGQKAREGLIPSLKIGGSRRFSLPRLREWIERQMDNGKRGQ